MDVRLRPRRRTPLAVAVTSPYGDRPGPRAPGSGAGLIGMRERVALLGGSSTAGPRTGRGQAWRVRAALPVADAKHGEA